MLRRNKLTFQPVTYAGIRRWAAAGKSGRATQCSGRAASFSGDARKLAQQLVQRADGRSVGNAIHPRRPEMALKRPHHGGGLGTVDPVNLQTVAVKRKHGLQRFHGLAGIALLEKAPAADRQRLDPVADAFA
jgi:hypothetical protein